MRIIKLILFSALVYSSSAFARGPEVQAGLFSFLKDIFNSGSSVRGSQEPGGTYVPPTRPYVAPVETPIPPTQGTAVDLERGGRENVNVFDNCRDVIADSTVLHTVFVPINSAPEWAAFREGDSLLGERRRPLPPGVTLAACGGGGGGAGPGPGAPCGPRMAEGAIWAALGYDAQAQLTAASPRAGNRPRINATPATLNYICRAMGCGDHNWRSVRGWSSPSDNTLIDWNGSAWYKRPGSAEYGGVHLSTTSSTGQILSCAAL